MKTTIDRPAKSTVFSAETLSLLDIQSYRNQGAGVRSGDEIRFFCPIHAGENQRSFSLNEKTGEFFCHKCGAKGVLREKRESRAQTDDPVVSLAALRGWNVASLRALGAYAQNGSCCFPMRNAGGTVVGFKRRRGDGEAFHGGVKSLTNRGGKGGLIHPWPFPSEGVVLVVEGEADAVAAIDAGVYTVIATPGSQLGRVAREALPKLLADRDVVLCPDPDKAGRKWRKSVTTLLTESKCSVRVIEPEKEKDLDDRLRDALDKTMLLERLIKNACAEEKEKATQKKKPVLQANCGDLDLITEHSWKVLIDTNEPAELFRFGDESIRLNRDEDGRAKMVPLDRNRLRNRLAEKANWVKFKDGEATPAFPPVAVCDNILASPQHPLPGLERLALCPVFSQSGVLIDTPGYHPESQIFYSSAPGFVLPRVPQKPTQEEITSARNFILDVFQDFPFVDHASRAHTIAFLITHFLRSMIRQPVPFFVFSKPAPGVGATLCIRIAGRIFTGAEMPLMSLPKIEEETRKKLTAALRRNPNTLIFDNVKARVDSENLAIALTASVWSDRVLGFSEEISFPIHAVFGCTGNNVLVGEEISRRTVLIRLDARTPCPWMRDPKSFQHEDIISWVADNRAQIIHAICTLIQAWIAKKKPEGDKSLGGFESWSKIIGGVLQVAGINGFLENLIEFYRSCDEESETNAAFIRGWFNSFQTNKISAGSLFYVAGDSGVNLGGGNEQSQKSRLGHYVKSLRDRRFSILMGDNKTEREFVVRNTGVSQKLQQWMLVPAPTR